MSPMVCCRKIAFSQLERKYYKRKYNLKIDRGTVKLRETIVLSVNQYIYEPQIYVYIYLWFIYVVHIVVHVESWSLPIGHCSFKMNWYKQFHTSSAGCLQTVLQT